MQLQRSFFLFLGLVCILSVSGGVEAVGERLVKVTVNLDGTAAPPLPATFRELLVQHFEPLYNESNPLFAWEPPEEPSKIFPMNAETRTFLIELSFFDDGNSTAQARADKLTQTVSCSFFFSLFFFFLLYLILRLRFSLFLS